MDEGCWSVLCLRIVQHRAWTCATFPRRRKAHRQELAMWCMCAIWAGAQRKAMGFAKKCDPGNFHEIFFCMRHACALLELNRIVQHRACTCATLPRRRKAHWLAMWCAQYERVRSARRWVLLRNVTPEIFTRFFCVRSAWTEQNCSIPCVHLLPRLN